MSDHDKAADNPGDPAAAAAWSSAIATGATGTSIPAMQAHRLEQVARTAGAGADPDALDEAKKTAIYGLIGINPRNELEGMLVSQMIATHQNAMNAMYFASESLASPEARDREMRYAAKLMQLFTQQASALNKLRGSDLFENYTALNGHASPYAPRKGKPAG